MAADRSLPAELRSLIRAHHLPVRRDPPDAGRKMSECLMELIDPYVVEEMPAKHFRVLVAAGAIAWNLSVVSFDDPDGKLRAMLTDLKLDPENRQVFIELVGELRHRKEQLFPEDDRVIAHWDIREQGRGRYFLTAASLVAQD